ncbi:MAG: DUF1559 domain-containing protein [Pirellulales bacterium]
MPIHFRCPHCGAEGSAADQYAGTTGPCARCGQTLTIPAAAGAASPALAPATKTAAAGMSIGVIIAIAAGCMLLAACVLPALLLPAVQAARDSARQSSSIMNMKQIVLAMQNHHDGRRSFPAAYTVDENGKPLHSWRVHLLPYVESSPLYSQIRLDEPWDSPHNSQFHDRAPPVYHSPSDAGAPTDTSYMVVVGDETMFPPNGDRTKLTQITDGTSRTIALVENSESGVNWMEPVDLEFDKMSFRLNSGPNDPRGAHRATVLVAYADGAVGRLPENLSPQDFRSLLTASGGEPFQPPH